MRDPEFKYEYDALEEEFALFDELLKAWQAADLTQGEVAKTHGDKTSAIARLETGGEASNILPRSPYCNAMLKRRAVCWRYDWCEVGVRGSLVLCSFRRENSR